MDQIPGMDSWYDEPPGMESFFQDPAKQKQGSPFDDIMNGVLKYRQMLGGTSSMPMPNFSQFMGGGQGGLANASGVPSVKGGNFLSGLSSGLNSDLSSLMSLGKFAGLGGL